MYVSFDGNFSLFRRFGKKELYADMLAICGNCSNLFWQVVQMQDIIVLSLLLINCLPYNKNLELPKLKAFADVKIHAIQKLKFVS